MLHACTLICVPFSLSFRIKSWFSKIPKNSKSCFLAQKTSAWPFSEILKNSQIFLEIPSNSHTHNNHSQIFQKIPSWSICSNLHVLELFGIPRNSQFTGNLFRKGTRKKLFTNFAQNNFGFHCFVCLIKRYLQFRKV